jgi:beta-xylosidase
VADALPRLPDWAGPGFTWAPAVTHSDIGWVLAFTARHAASGRQCIGVATSPVVGGPYSPAAEPLVCDIDRGGSIDPSFVTDDAGGQWLLYKDDGNCCGLPTTLHAVPLTPDATALAGPAVDLLSADLSWEAGLVEAPSMAKVGDRWLLLYSASRWDTAGYAVGASWCDSPAGPCVKQSAPALTAGGGLDGPGGVEFVSTSRTDQVMVTFHAWPPGEVGYGDGSTRRLQLGRVEVVGDTVSIVPLTSADR